jgi:hypothetical protein
MDFWGVGVSIERYEEPGSGGIAGLRVYSGDGKEPQVQSLSSKGQRREGRSVPDPSFYPIPISLY